MGRPVFLDLFTRFAGRLTRRFPRRGAGILDAILYPLMGNGALAAWLGARQRRALKGVKKFERLLVVSDIHLGDAVLFQTAVSALKDFFPEARVDYLVNRSLKELLSGHPDISDLWPALGGGQFPGERDRLTVQSLSGEYDAVFNFCPFLPRSSFCEGTRVFHFTDRAPLFVRNERHSDVPNHIAYQAHRYIYDLLSSRFTPRRDRPFEGPEVFLSRSSVESARVFLAAHPPSVLQPLIFLNPDTASPYTRIPPRFLMGLLEGLLKMPCGILLGDGHTDKGTGRRLLRDLPSGKRGRVTLVPPELSLEAYTALIDQSDLFLSGDTGPLHLAAAWKRGEEKAPPLRNRTAVLGIFGATPPRFSGYDSRPGFLESEQKAESHSYQSVSPCRNLTCMHKMAKECDAAGCFQGLDLGRILQHVRNLLVKARISAPA